MATKIETPPAKAWAQVADQALNVPNTGSPQMRRYYKMPTSGCKNVLNAIKIGSSLESVQNWVLTSAGALDNGLSGANFNPETNEHWILNSYQMEQIEAGEYMLFKAVFAYTELDIDDIALSTDWSEQRTMGTQVTWQTYSVSPYIYCNEQDHVDSVVEDINDIPTPSGGNAKRAHIEACCTAAADARVNTSTYVYKNSFKNFVQLTESEVKIMEKVAAGVNPVFHKPVVQITQVFRTNNENNVPSTNQTVDRMTTSPGGVQVSGWDGQYIFTGRAWTKTVDTYYTAAHPEGVTIYTLTYVDTYEGALKPDPDFYGPNAWKFHEGPDRQS